MFKLAFCSAANLFFQKKHTASLGWPQTERARNRRRVLEVLKEPAITASGAPVIGEFLATRFARIHGRRKYAVTPVNFCTRRTRILIVKALGLWAGATK